MRDSRHVRAGIVVTSICLIAVAVPAWVWGGEVADPGLSGSQYPGGTIAAVGAAIMLLVEALRSPRLGWLVEWIPRRWRIVVPVVLSGIAGILSSVAGGMSWQEALYIGLFAGPTAVFAHEAVVEAILGHSRWRGKNPSTAPVPVTEPAPQRRVA
jgi:hypothetical protein